MCAPSEAGSGLLSGDFAWTTIAENLYCLLVHIFRTIWSDGCFFFTQGYIAIKVFDLVLSIFSLKHICKRVLKLFRLAEKANFPCCFLELPCLSGLPSFCSRRSKHCSGCRRWAHCIVGRQQWVLLTLHIMWPALKPVAAPVSLLEPIMQLVWVIYSYGCIELGVFSLERKWIAPEFEIDSALLKSSFLCM